MENDKEKWVDEVMGSLKGSERAKPAPDLFNRLESQLVKPNAHIVPAFRSRLAVAAAVVLLALNGFALSRYFANTNNMTSEAMVDRTDNQQLISNYKIYE